MMQKFLNIVFYGEDSFSNVVLRSLIETGHNVKAVITPFYDDLIYKKLEYTCNQNHIQFFRAPKINSEEVRSIVQEAAPDLCVITHFERLIKSPLLEIPKLGSINLHPSLLPYYRGMSPQHWPIINGETQTGITVHYVDESADTGDIILQRQISLNENMYVSDLQNIWMKEYKTVMTEAIDRILSDYPVKVQKDLKGSYYGKLRLEDCLIHREEGVRKAYNLVRGVSFPYMGARYANKIIYRAHIMCHGEEIENPERILEFPDGNLVIDMYKSMD